MPEEIAAAARQNAALYLIETPPEADAARRLLEQYSGIAPEDVDAYIRYIVSHLLCLRSSLNLISRAHRKNSATKPGPSSPMAASAPSLPELQLDTTGSAVPGSGGVSHCPGIDGDLPRHVLRLWYHRATAHRQERSQRAAVWDGPAAALLGAGA